MAIKPQQHLSPEVLEALRSTVLSFPLARHFDPADPREAAAVAEQADLIAEVLTSALEISGAKAGRKKRAA